MKIFNWVHRRFNHKDGLTQNYNYHEKKNVAAAGNIAYESSTTIENDDEHFVVVHNAAFDDGWKGGILTIGTLGYHPLLKDNDYMMSWPTLEEESENGDQDNNNNNINYKNNVVYENEEVNPLVHNYHDQAEGLLEIKMDALKDQELEFDDHVMIMKINNPEKERTTLADLFIADSDQKKEPTNKHTDVISGHEELVVNNKNIKNEKKNKNSFSFPNKLIGGEGRPMHKFNRLMRRMLKRKIHPDLDLNKYNLRDSQVWETKCEINESASLLPIQDVGI